MPSYSDSQLCLARPGLLYLQGTGTSSQMLIGYLKEKGFEVWSTNKDFEAFELFLQHCADIGWLVIENEFLNAVGQDFIKRFLRHFPGVLVCFLTRDPFDFMARELAWNGVTIIPKPVHLRNFVKTLTRKSTMVA